MCYSNKKCVVISLVYLFVAFFYYPVCAQNKKWTLDECIKHALQENVTLNQGITNNEINKINYTQSKANQLPNLNLADAHSLNYGHPINPSTGQYTHQDISANTLGLTSSITLFNGLKYINLIKENRLNYEAGNMDIQKLRNDLMLNVIAAYMQVLFEYEAVETAHAQVEITKEHLNYTEKYVKARSMPESNLLQIQAQLATDEAAEVDAENQLQLAKVTLMQFMEMPVTSDFNIIRPDKTEIDPDISMTAEEIYSKSLSFLPEVKNASLKTNIVETGLKISKSEIMPKLTLTGNLNTSYSSANSLLSYQTTSNISHIGYLADNPTEIVEHMTIVTSQKKRERPCCNEICTIL